MFTFEDECMTDAEVNAAIKCLSNGKTAGEDI